MLRNYQNEAVTKLRKVLMKGYKRPVLVLSTGSGKSIIYGELIRLMLNKGKKVLFIVNRRNLIFQFEDTLVRYFDIKPGIIMSGVSTNLYNDVQLATVQTFSRRMDLGSNFIVDADCVLIDEGHFAVSPTYKKVIDAYEDKIIIGTTATPCRLDCRPLGDVYDKIVEVISHSDLIKKGYLVPMRYFAPSTIDLSGVKIASHTKDYNLKQLADKVDKPKIAGDCVENWLKHGENRKTLVFAVNVKHSIHLRDEFLKHGVPAEHLDARSTDEERQKVFDKIDSGEIRVICNVALYTYGMDCPGISSICIVRPTKSFALYRQMCGRGTRIEENKTDCLLFDHGSNIDNHGFIEDDVEWTLEGEEKAFQKPKQEEKTVTTLQCRVCNQIFIDLKECPTCGTELKTFGKKIESTDDELTEIKNKKKANRDMSWDEKVLFISGLKHIAKIKGYKHGWVAHNYRSITNVWPNDKRLKDAEPIEATGSTKNLITHIMIKKAKSYQKVLQSNT